MRIFVTGVDGQLSQSLIDRADEFDVEIIARGLPELDFTNPDFERFIDEIKPDAVINAAAFTNVDGAEDMIELANQINGYAVGSLAKACAKNQIPLVHVSTDYVFSGDANRPYLEADLTGPQSVYGSSKLLGEQEIVKHTDNYAILRTAWVISPYGKNFLKTMLALAKAGKTELNVVCDQFGCPTSALNLAEACVVVARNLVNNSDKSLRGIFHACGLGETNWASFADFIFQTAKDYGHESCIVNPITSDQYPTRAKRPKYSVLNNSKLKELHNFELMSWETATRQTISILLKE